MECRRQDPSNFVAVQPPRSLKLRRSDPLLPPELAAPAAAAACAAAPATATQRKAGKGACRRTGGKQILSCSSLMNAVQGYAEIEQQFKYRLNFIMGRIPLDRKKL